jgi:7,8-dihydropterin-6-yl-methyl-4-(beta-D-ribofuranosyl)aminobenzene 5'-phosphate synthase
MKITTLIENTKDEKTESVKAEHGISLFLEFDSHKVLFDMGLSSLFYENAKHLNLPLEEVEFAVVSHGHLDHGGGLKTFLEANSKAPIYVKEEAFNGYYRKIAGFIKKYIGLDKALISTFKQRFVFVKGFTEIGDGIFIITDILENHSKPVGNKQLLSQKNGSYVPDEFKHELILVIREQDGLVVFTGCSHNGILNMVETVEKRFKGKRIKTVFGGFHMMNPATKKMTETHEEVIKIGRVLSEKTHLKKVFTGHCTGKKAYDILKSQIGEKLGYFSTGSIISI